MKKLLVLLLALTLCMVSSALAEDPIVINAPGEYTIELSSTIIQAATGPAISIESSGVKLNILLKDGTESILMGAIGYAGIAISDAEITIRCESAGENHTCGDSCGKLTVAGGTYGAGIGGSNDQDFTGKLTILGGNVTALCGSFSAGIGGANGGAFKGSVLISGGNVYAAGDNWAAGIGSADDVMSGSVKITGGNVTAIGGTYGAGIGTANGALSGTIEITGGSVDATGGISSAGIGSSSATVIANISGTIDISGGTVNATGGIYGAGIGSGQYGSLIESGSISISGGTITAIGDGGAGIGSGRSGHLAANSSISITGGTVEAKANGGGAGIGAGFGGDMAGTVSVSGGTVSAEGAGNSAGIGAGNNGTLSGTVELSGGTVTAKGGNNGAGIGSGARGVMSGKVLVKGGNVTAIAGETVMQDATEPAPAIGASCLATPEDSTVIEVNPASGKIAVKAGADASSAAALEGSPFTAKTRLNELLADKLYAKFEFIAPPATPVPNQGGSAPDIPETGDSTNFALLALLAAVSMIGITVILRRKNEA